MTIEAFMAILIAGGIGVFLIYIFEGISWEFEKEQMDIDNGQHLRNGNFGYVHTPDKFIEGDTQDARRKIIFQFWMFMLAAAFLLKYLGLLGF